MTEADRLRQEVKRHPTVEGYLRLGNCLYGSEVLREMSEALTAYRMAELMCAGRAVERPTLYGSDGRPMASGGPIQGLPALEWDRARKLMRRIVDRVRRGEGEMLPGLHRPMDADRKFRPRGVPAAGWDALGTRSEIESWAPMKPMSREESEAPMPAPLGPLAEVPGEPDEEGVLPC